MHDFLGPCLGGGLAILGGFAGTWFQTKLTRRRRMEELIAERKVAIYAEAYSRVKRVQTLLSSSSLQKVDDYILSCETWFWESRLFLPRQFPDKWLSVRNGVAQATGLEHQPDNKSVQQLASLRRNLADLTAEVGEEIYREMGLKEIKIDPRIQTR